MEVICDAIDCKYCSTFFKCERPFIHIIVFPSIELDGNLTMTHRCNHYEQEKMNDETD